MLFFSGFATTTFEHVNGFTYFFLSLLKRENKLYTNHTEKQINKFRSIFMDLKFLNIIFFLCFTN